jgi:hypothetical protein
MAYQKSVLDQISDALALPMREIQDLKLDVGTGQKVSLLRITSSNYSEFDDELEDKAYSLTASIVENAIMQYPLSERELASDLSGGGRETDTAIDLLDILPINVYINHEGDFNSNITSLKTNDLLVHILLDERGNKVPVILQVTRPIGQFLGKNLIRRSYRLALERGTLEAEIQTVIDNYVASFGVPTISGTIPDNNATGVDVNSTVTVGFEIPVNETLANTSGFIFSPEIASPTYTWNSESTQVVISGSVALTSGTIYSGTIDKDYIQSDFGLYMESDYPFEFTTV